MFTVLALSGTSLAVPRPDFSAGGHHGDHHRKPSGYHGGTEGLTFGDRIPGRETSPFDPVRN